MKRKLIIAVMAGSLSLLAACSPQKTTAPGTSSTASTATESAAPATESAAPAAETTSPAPEDIGQAYHKLTPEEAKKMMGQDNVIIVDVRTSEEFREKHIPDAVLVPNETITTDQEPQELPDKDATLLIYCRTGNRSKDASDKLIELGYKNVYDFGGITDWPYETVSEVVGGT